MSDSIIQELRHSGHPALAKLLVEIRDIAIHLADEIRAAQSLPPHDGLASVITAQIRAQLSIAGAKHMAGLGQRPEILQRKIAEQWRAKLARSLSIHEIRALATAVCHDAGARHPSSAAADQPKQAAMRMAATILRDPSNCPEETFAQSIQRFRKAWRGQYVLRLDEDSMAVTAHRAEDVLIGMQIGKRGRPPKKVS